jgi:glycosyltransferase involved in cell wall biosynthesis
MPTVSVITPTYNRAEYLEGAIETVLDQTYDDIEMIVANDASTDETRSVLKQYTTDDRVRALHNEKNRGISVSRNRAAEIAQGTYLCILDDDDRWHRTKVEKQVRMMERLGEEYAVIYTGGIRRGERTGHVIRTFEPERRGNIYPEVLGSWQLDPHSGHMIRKSCFEAVSGFDPEMTTCNDWELSIRLARKYKFDYIAEPLVEQIDHGENTSSVSTASNEWTHSDGWEKIYEKYGDEIVNYPEVRRVFHARWDHMRGIEAISSGAHGTAIRRFWSAFNRDPTVFRALLVGLAVLGPRAFALGGKVQRTAVEVRTSNTLD